MASIVENKKKIVFVSKQKVKESKGDDAVGKINKLI